MKTRLLLIALLASFSALGQQIQTENELIDQHFIGVDVSQEQESVFSKNEVYPLVLNKHPEYSEILKILKDSSKKPNERMKAILKNYGHFFIASILQALPILIISDGDALAGAVALFFGLAIMTVGTLTLLVDLLNYSNGKSTRLDKMTLRKSVRKKRRDFFKTGTKVELSEEELKDRNGLRATIGVLIGAIVLGFS